MKKMVCAVLTAVLSVSALPAQMTLADNAAAFTRAQAANLLYQAAGSPETKDTAVFSDVSGPLAPAICWAAENSYINGIGDGRYDPGSPVTRQEFTVMLYRQAGSPALSGAELHAFADAGSISDWAHDAMLWGVKTGVISNPQGTALAPAGHLTAAQADQMLQCAELLPNTEQLSNDLSTLTATHRPIGSEGEQAAAAYLQTRFSAMGYTVSTQPYTADDGKTGTNVIAIKEAPQPDADILVISAHHDSVPTAYGANDNASGVTALLAIAEQMQDVPTDTELRFISFTDEENGKNGSRSYTASLSEQERGRMVGDIQLDMLGGAGASGLALFTTDGESNWLSGLLLQQNSGLSLGAETASDHTSFQLAGIPAVLLMQNGRGYLYHSAADVAAQIDLYALGNAVQTVSGALLDIVSDQTESYRQTAQSQGNGYTYRQTRQTVIYFGSSLKDSEAYIGAAGALSDHYEIQGDGWTDEYDIYLYPMRWFDGEAPMNTYYRYRNGFLEGIEIRPAETGYTAQQVYDLMAAMYGEPDSTETTEESGRQANWTDEIYSKHLTFSESPDCTVSVGNYSVGLTNVLGSYPVSQGQAAISDPRHQQVWDYLCSILPDAARQKMTEFNLYTDGYSNILAYTSPIQDETGKSDNTQFAINIDYYDVYDENGKPRDWSKLTYTILHEYGHVLLEDETQVDLAVGTSTHDPAGFIPGSFRKAFYDEFWQDIGTTGVNDYEQNPTHYVSRYGANYFHEDIADTFAIFVLGDKPSGSTVAEQKLLFFWNDSDMTALRSSIRTLMGLDS